MIAHLSKDNRIYLELLTPELEGAVENRFSVKHPRAMYSTAYEAGHWDGMVCLYNKRTKSLDMGFLDELIKLCKEKDLPFDIEDNRKPIIYEPIPRSELTSSILPDITLDDHQMRCCKSIYQDGISSRRGIHKHITGAGKCLGKGTGVILYDGRIKRVENIIVGDLLMGDDSTPRKVLSVCSGVDSLYKVRQLNGNDYVVNEPHILSLKTSPRKKSEERVVTDISVVDYLASSNGKKHRLKGYKVPVSFEAKNVPFDPYFLGLWSGDGIAKDLQIIVGDDDEEIVSYLEKFSVANNMVLVEYPHYGRGCRSYAIRMYEGVVRPPEHGAFDTNWLRDTFKKLELFSNKHIPDLFKYNSESVRLGVLAGFIDSDGEAQVEKDTCVITHRQGRLIDDICYISRSLGFKVTSSVVRKKCTTTDKEGIYASLTLSGNLSRIPTKLVRKHFKDRRINKDPLVCGISIEHIGAGEYYGFELDGNKRFLLEDFTVTHNTEMMAAIVKMFPNCPTAIIAEEVIVSQQIKQRLELRKVGGGDGVGAFYAGKRPDGQLVVVGSIQALQTPQLPERKEGEEKHKWIVRLKAYETRRKNAMILQKIIGKCHLIMVDECDRAASDQYDPLFNEWAKEARYFYGFSGTPFSKRKPIENLVLRGRLGEVVSESERDEVEALGRIIPVSFTMVAVGEDGDKYDRTNNNDAIKMFMEEGEDLHNVIYKICKLYEDEGKLILVDRTKLGMALEEKIPGSVFIHGKTTLKRRNEATQGFEKRSIKVLIGSKILMRGLDLKGGTENLILCYDGKSDQEFLQRIGRALRKNSKGSARVFDFFFLNNYYLYAHSRERLKNLVDQKYESYVLLPKSGMKIPGEELIKRRFRLPKPSKNKT